MISYIDRENCTDSKADFTSVNPLSEQFPGRTEKSTECYMYIVSDESIRNQSVNQSINPSINILSFPTVLVSNFYKALQNSWLVFELHIS